jgi:EAL domain-containing protein (putative c-di-GMP-specific phosphodiesterase class I)/ABC-type amino acid transport substrate-binding protein/GGDEF domain-containing protein
MSLISSLPKISAVLLMQVGLLAAAESESPQQPEVTFGGALYYPPFHYPLNNGELTGVDVAIIRHVAGEEGWQLQEQTGLWSSMLERLEVGDVDVVPMFMSDERSGRFLFSIPYHVSQHFLYATDTNAAINALAELTGKVVAAEQSSYALAELLRANPQVRVLETDSEAAALRSVSAGEADFAIVPEAVALFTITTESLALQAISPPLFPQQYAFGVTRLRPELVEPINQTLVAMRRAGTLDEIKQQFIYGQPEPSAGFPFAELTIALFAVVAIYGYYRRNLRLDRMLTFLSLQLSASEREVIRSRLTDYRTGMHNREYILDEVGKLLKGQAEGHSSIGVGMLRLHGLNALSEHKGYELAESIIRDAADVISQSTRCSVAYLGNWDIAVLMSDLPGEQVALEEMKKLVATISSELESSENGYVFFPRMGMALAKPEHGVSAVELLRRAQISVSEAEREARQVMLYRLHMDDQIHDTELAADLRKAIANRQISWLFQPKYHVQQRRICGAEMLVRWQHARHGPIAPDRFIKTAENAGFIQELSREVVLMAAQVVENWQAENLKLELAINISANDLADTAFSRFIQDTLREFASHINLEITETALIRRPQLVYRGICGLRDCGMKVSLDDYGTGYSSMDYLKKFEFDEIKIDKGFMMNLQEEARNRKLVESSIRLIHDLNAQAVAEGVEDEWTYNYLCELGCDKIQGYHLSPPVTLDKFESMLA